MKEGWKNECGEWEDERGRVKIGGYEIAKDMRSLACVCVCVCVCVCMCVCVCVFIYHLWPRSANIDLGVFEGGGGGGGN